MKLFCISDLHGNLDGLDPSGCDLVIIAGDFAKMTGWGKWHMYDMKKWIEKKFIPTKANMKGVSLTPYKVVKRGWFCYVTVTSRNGEKISLALYDEMTPAIVSSSYVVFRSKDENVLSPEYLYLLFNRATFDRYSRFNSWGSARETFDFSEMCRVEIPFPPIELQKSIAAVYNCLQKSKRIVEETRALMKNLCPALVQKAAHSA